MSHKLWIISLLIFLLNYICVSKYWDHVLCQVNIFINLKGTAHLIGSDPLLMKWHVGFITVPFQSFSMN